MSSGFVSYIVACVVTSIPLVLARRTKHIRAKIKNRGEKYIDVSPLYFWLVYGVGGIFLVAGGLIYWLSDEPIAGIGFAVMGFIFVLLSAVLQVLDTTVTWTSDYICGAKSGNSFKQNTIFWGDIVSVSSLPNKTLKIHDCLDQNVHWTVYQAGWYEIIEDLRLYRPDIDTSDFD